MPVATDKVLAGLERAYWMEIETVQSYICNSVNLDGVRAEEIKRSLAADVMEEIGHAQSFAKRIKELGGIVPGSMAFRPNQKSLQPTEDTTDVVRVIRGVIEAEAGAIEAYRDLIEAAEEARDYVTADLVTTILADEESHRREFLGFLKEYER
ncbi:MAG: ferritin-like domain-containing protein [Gemmatimonadetes bacterium]|nr:ferritin-like domain-containing protein [Gemmatimonadota bacterium]